MPDSRASCRSSKTGAGISTLQTQARRVGVRRKASITSCIVKALLPAPGAPAVSAVTAESLTGLDILVVDDDHDARTLLVLLLEARGAAVRTSSTVREALDAIEAHPPDVLLSDLRMPDESGYALIRRVREREAGSGAARLLCIAVTAYARGVDRQQALEAGFDGHVVKPVDPDRLSETITRAVQPRSVDRGRGT